MSAYGVKFVESVDSRVAGHTVPVVAASCVPEVRLGSTQRRESKWAKLTGFATNAILISAQKCSFQRITLKSSHRVFPSLVDCSVALTSIEVWQKKPAIVRLAAGVASQGVDAVATSTCAQF